MKATRYVTLPREGGAVHTGLCGDGDGMPERLLAKTVRARGSEVGGGVAATGAAAE